MNGNRSAFRMGWQAAAAMLLFAPLAEAEPTPTIAAAHHLTNDYIAAAAAVDRRPLAFEANRGQVDETVRFLGRGAGYDVYLTDHRAIVQTTRAGGPGSAIGLRFIAPRAASNVVAEAALPGRSHYLIDGDPSRHVVDVDTFERVRYESVYPGIDVVYYGTAGKLEYDVVVAPGADPRQARIAFEGAERVELSDAGALVLHTAAGTIRFERPEAYQSIDGVKRSVDAAFVVHDDERVGFRIGDYDPAHPLVIDPILSLATTLWGSASGIAVDSARNIYVLGTTTTTDLPATNGYQTQLAGRQDAFVLKLNPSGTAVTYATYLGARRAATSGGASTAYGVGGGIAVDAAGNAYFTGTTDSTAFPVTPGAYRSSGSRFVTKLNAAGNALVYSTFVDFPVSGIAVDSQGNLLIARYDGVAKLNPGGTAMLYSRPLKGAALDETFGIAVDAGGSAYAVGVARSTDFPTLNPMQASLRGTTDAFVSKLDPSGNLVYSTYLGGSGDERGFAIAVDAAGQAHVTGWTKSSDFPVTAQSFQRAIGYADPAISNAFVTKINSAGSALVYSSYLGGKWCFTPTVSSCLGLFSRDEGIDAGTSIAVDRAGYAYVGGYATSTLFPLVDSVQGDITGGDAWHIPFVAKVSPPGDRLTYVTVLGAKVQDGGTNQVAIDGAGGVVGLAHTPGASFPRTAGAAGTLSYSALFKLASGVYPTTVQSSINPASPAQPITLTATVLDASPGATVTFRDGATTIGTAIAANGRAALTLSLAAGVHRITATSNADNLTSPPYLQLVKGQ